MDLASIIALRRLALAVLEKEAGKAVKIEPVRSHRQAPSWPFIQVGAFPIGLFYNPKKYA